MSKQKEEFEIIDPLQMRAVAMVKDLRGHSRHNQALALMAVRRKDPKLAVMIVRMLHTTQSPGTSSRTPNAPDDFS